MRLHCTAGKHHQPHLPSSSVQDPVRGLDQQGDGGGHLGGRVELQHDGGDLPAVVLLLPQEEEGARRGPGGLQAAAGRQL